MYYCLLEEQRTSGAVEVGSPVTAGSLSASQRWKCRLGQASRGLLIVYRTQAHSTLGFSVSRCGGRGGWGDGERSGRSVSVSAWQQCLWPPSRLWTGQREFSNKGRRGDSVLGGGEQGTIWLGWQEGLLLGKSESSYKGLVPVDPFHLKSGASLQEQDPHQHES